MELPDNEQNQEVTDPKDEETSDWTEVLELERKARMQKPYDIEVLATSKVPHNIPYLEVYRTDELYYEPYVSPYLSVSSTAGGGSGSGENGENGDGSGSSEGSALWSALSDIVWNYYPRSTAKDYWIGRLRTANNNWSDVAVVVNKMGGDKDKQNEVIRKVLDAKKKYPSGTKSDKALRGMKGSGISDQVYSSLTKNAKLKSALKKAIKPYYKSNANLDTIVKRYMTVLNTKVHVSAVTGKYSKYLKHNDSATIKKLNAKVISLKDEYSK